ncbi:unspecified product [Leptomonas pyrrhocoris]|uniref:Unspecified product n=1 Tax=Leptomonas pyrrhocoris TaxID=157538 RepID=A0A0M9FXH2_LEPPY|nr:unspecified product [Leptomonas pyrrhocoris]XP_015656387.1 unspecified product [Leptomonas pyrrhocoris]KPA77947.1 unspecified product [Leptomonas pyrrhocoris]KPA77948.1 unspecified product [Leptomonas pyrrhocoris]|eukprot:XP_015656386.1 unspecified product [Leptomonas pyrrhocoris]
MADAGGRTTKQTYVTKYTTDVDPRGLPDFASRGVVTGDDKDGNDDEWQQQQQSDGSRRPSQQQRRPHRGSVGAPPPPQRRPTHSPSHSASPASSMPDSTLDEVDGHRLRKKYTVTTVTTVTTTTILLPKMQEAFIFPSMTSHQMEQQPQPYPTITNGQPRLSRQQQPEDRVYQIHSTSTSASASPDRNKPLQPGSHNQQHSLNGQRLVAAPSPYGTDGPNTQTWTFNQQTANEVTTEERRGRLPTLEELGIASYFGKDGAPSQQPRPQRRAAPYTPSDRRGSGPQQQPWIASETRHEVEGGKRYY